ncbi:hypothetical protein FB567DRAFT_434635 [Paraphoma chrysanthemicola]|uniref:Uncharacterized protein n=1 Tax=Paraphoma chrysanthemicola TaxID=798071 RepID=A0A8K0RB57_9PLEO|nr:hypothetical protein FB567DRAFT_434635 [Paraphoma chrysanthemicola]
MSPIYDLCSALHKNCTDCIGFLEQDEYRFVVYNDAVSTTQSSIPVTSLCSLLEQGSVFTRRKRYCLAFMLAASFMRLGATPWFNTRLQKDNIVFFSNSSDPQAAILDCPYITQEMCKATHFRKNLGTGDAQSSSVLDWAAAMQWSKLASEEAGPDYAGAVDWCLRANELNDPNWRKDFAQNVLIPLELCYRQILQKP